MSDGNFNRSMLPSNSYQSGVRAGQARMQHFAEEALQQALETHASSLSEEAKSNIISTFRTLLKGR